MKVDAVSSEWIEQVISTTGLAFRIIADASSAVEVNRGSATLR